jgi:hypothetical protein
MHLMHRLTAVTVTAAALFLTTASMTAAPASADYTSCGAHTHTDRTRVTGGYSVKVRIHYRNCGYQTARVRPDVSNRIDPGCQTVYSGQTAYWSFDYSYYDGFAGGTPAYRGMYYC